MRFSQLSEARDYVYYNQQDVGVPVYKNPTKAEFRYLLERCVYEEYLRGLVVPNDGMTLFWDGGLATHYEIANDYGLEVPLYAVETSDPNSVTYLYNNLMHPDVDPEEVVKWMKSLPVFRHMTVKWIIWRNVR